VTAYAGHCSIIDEDLVDGEPLAHLRTGLDGRLDQQLVENRAARTVPITDPVDCRPIVTRLLAGVPPLRRPGLRRVVSLVRRPPP
jgi:hypothetical protein